MSDPDRREIAGSPDEEHPAIVSRPGEEAHVSVSRLPERDRRAMEGRWRLSNLQMGVVMVVLVVIGTYLAFAKDNPLTGDGYTLNATFRNSVNVRVDSPVRIAGVDVGKVTEVRRNGDGATATFTVSDDGRPVRADAMVAIRPRIFFEGNWFLDLAPGAPSANELPSGGTIPVSRTSTAVQFDEVLSALKAPQREDLGKVLVEYGRSLTRKPTRAEDADQQPEARGKSGGQALNDTFSFGAEAGRESARVTEAFQGTEPGDLARLIGSSGRFFGALSEREGELQNLISDFNTTMGAFAAEADGLARSVEELGPTIRTAKTSFESLDDSLPHLRRYAIELRPAVAEIPDTIVAAEPWLAAAHPLLSKGVLGSVAGSLEHATPELAGAQRAGNGALRELSALARCTDDVLVPTGDQVIADQFSTGQPNYKEFFYATVGITGESQGFDGNGPFLRIQSGGGEERVRADDVAGNLPTDKVLWANTFEAPTGTQPILGPAPPKEPTEPCQNQSVPDLNGPLGGVGVPSPRAP